mmetsp:Transcript_11637/g.25507  ORF Transcript_11637/g.25507 Transcript_11637/m.25507 type:complete len:711 (-) Transcript_11637:161-2293(-)
MPTLGYQYQGGGCTIEDKSTSNTPQSVTVSIALSAHDTKTGIDDCSSEKNNSSSSSSLPQAAAALPCSTPKPPMSNSFVESKKTVESSDSLRPQGQGITTASASQPSYAATLKSPTLLGGEPHMHSLNSGNSTAVTGAKSDAASLISDKYHHKTVQESNFLLATGQHHTQTKANGNVAPIKRTKKVAKPKSKTKAASRAKKLPTKKNKTGATVATPKEGQTTLSNKQSPITKRGGKSLPTRAKAVSLKSPRRKKDVHSNTSQSKIKTKKPKRSPPDGDATAKQTKMPKSDNQGSNISSTKKQVANNTKQGGKSSPTRIAGGETKAIEKVLSVVVNTVADEIRHCASVFGDAKRPKVVIYGEDEVPKKKTSSVTSDSRPSLLGVPQEFKQGKKQGAQTQSLGINSRNHVERKQEAASETNYSVKISAEGDIHPKKNNGCASEPHQDNIGAKESVELSEAHSHGGSSGLDLYDIRTVVIAVRRFVLEVYCPLLLSAKNNMGNKSPNADRIRLSTLLAIREMLIMNAEKLFTFASLKQSSTSMSERTYLSRVFANAIVRNAAKRIHSHQPKGQFLADFVQATQSYDAKSDDFQFSLARADVRSVCVHPEGEKFGQEETRLAQVSFNYARARHPLLYDKSFALEDDATEGEVKSERSLTHPVPSACAVFHIEAAATSASEETNKEDDAKILDSFKHMLRGKHKQHGGKSSEHVK